MSSSAGLHVVSWNIESLAPHLGDAPTRGALRDIVRGFGSPDVVCLQELRLRPNDNELLGRAAAALPGYVFAHALADDPKNASFRGGRVYGVGTYVKRTLRPTILPRASWDREGRLVVVTLPRLRLAIANVYAVNGTGKPHFDHEAGCVRGDRHGWKRRFHELLAEIVRAAEAGGLDTLLLGDFNVSQTRADTTPRLRTEEPHAGSRAHFKKTLVDDLGMVDVFRALHPEARAYTWFGRRSRPGRLDAARVDFALLPASRLEDVTRAWIDEGHAGHHGSDHAPLHVVLRRAR